MYGFEFGRASGMAPRARCVFKKNYDKNPLTSVFTLNIICYNYFFVPLLRIAVYKALYRLFGGFVADVVAAIEQV